MNRHLTIIMGILLGVLLAIVLYANAMAAGCYIENNTVHYIYTNDLETIHVFANYDGNWEYVGGLSPLRGATKWFNLGDADGILGYGHLHGDLKCATYPASSY